MQKRSIKAAKDGRKVVEIVRTALKLLQVRAVGALGDRVLLPPPPINLNFKDFTPLPNGSGT